MKNLTTRLAILLMLALMVITGVYDYTRLIRERERLVSQTQEDARVFAETLALAVSRNVRRGGTTDELRELLDDILARPGLTAIVIYDPDGQVVARHVAPGTPPPATDELVRGSLATREAALALVEAEGGYRLRYVQPFRWPGRRTGTLEVRQTLEGVEQAFRREIRDRLVSRLVVLAAFVLSIVALARWSIARPIRALIQGARAVGRGDLDQRIELVRRDEIGQLAEEFNRMAANLQAASQEAVRQAEERLRLEQEAQQAQKLAAVGLLAAKVAHEIGTPLNIISGRAEVLERVVPRDHPERRHLEVILKQSERISGIIRALLDYTRPKRPVLRDEEVLPILAQVADLLRRRCRGKEVRIHLDLARGLPPVLANADQLQQLFLNLLLNAVDASPRGGTIRVSAGPEPASATEGRARIVRGKVEGPHLTVHILDRGEGIPPDRLNHIFQPFVSSKEGGDGTGLGLPIVEEIVRAHRGEVEILSAPGQGTEAIVRLPLAPSGIAPAEREPASARGDHGR